MFCNVIETLHVSHADFKRFVMFCKRLSSDSAGIMDFTFFGMIMYLSE